MPHSTDDLHERRRMDTTDQGELVANARLAVRRGTNKSERGTRLREVLEQQPDATEDTNGA